GVWFHDASGLYWMPTGVAGLYKKTTLKGQSMSGNVLTLDFQLDFNGPHPFRYEVRSQGKQLRIRGLEPAGNLNAVDTFCGTAFGTTTGIEHPVPVRMQGTLSVPI